MNKKDIFQVIIIGAGPAGLFCAIQATNVPGDTLLIEKNGVPGQKLSIAGSGQCNITHAGDIRNFFTHYGDHGKFLRPALLNYPNSSLITFLRDRGLGTVITSGGKVFPATLKSSDIIRVLKDECRKRKVRLRYGEPVSGISKEQDIFTVHSNKAAYSGRNVVIATGGMSYPSTGSTGDGYIFAEAFGHSITELAPALTPAVIEKWPFGDLAGISFENIQFTLWRGGKKQGSHEGDLLFTHRGISGPGILDYSRYIRPGDFITVNFLRTFTKELFSTDFIMRLSAHPVSGIKTVLLSYSLPERFISKVLELSGIPPDITCAHLTREQRTGIINAITSFPLKVRALGGFLEAMVTRGGVSLNEINPKTMESHISPGLYCIGEVLDIDGDTGGYNIQAAFSTGFLAGTHVRQKSGVTN
jgi:predicted Rossmann fold flavoprotein